MGLKDKRNQYEEREQFSEVERYEISRKSDNKCVWCGRKVFDGYGGTVDHFIPLKKGGTNDKVNLVWMCKDCNKKKGSKLIPVSTAAYHLPEPYSAELEKHVDNYLIEYDYISRGNLLAFDIYEVRFLPEVLASAYYRSKKRSKQMNIDYKQSKYCIKRAYPEDEERIVQYYIKYLKKYSRLDSEEAARNNVAFWMRFGVIYFIEKLGEISVFATVLVNRNGYLSLNVFSYYSTDIAKSATRGIVTCIGEALVQENDFPYVPISVNMLVNDTVSRRILNLNRCTIYGDTIACTPYFFYNEEYYNNTGLVVTKEEFDAGVERLKAFLKRFRDIEDDIMMYLYKNDLMSYTWMATEALERNLFSDEPGPSSQPLN